MSLESYVILLTDAKISFHGPIKKEVTAYIHSFSQDVCANGAVLFLANVVQICILGVASHSNLSCVCALNCVKSAELNIVLSIKPSSTNDVAELYLSQHTLHIPTAALNSSTPSEITHASQAFLVHYKMKLLSVYR